MYLRMALNLYLPRAGITDVCLYPVYAVLELNLLAGQALYQLRYIPPTPNLASPNAFSVVFFISRL